MNQTFLVNTKLLSVEAQQRRSLLTLSLWVALLLGSMALQVYFVREAMPAEVMIAWMCLLIGVAAVVYEPRNGVYILASMSIFGDGTLTPWFPFRKNFSSAESLLYFNNSFSFTPLEICIALTFAIWFLRMAFQRKWEVRFTALLLPISLFTAFVAFGVAYGLGRGGDRVIGLWEARGIFYILPVYLLASNLLTKKSHVNILLWAVILPNIGDAIYGFNYVATELQFELGGIERIGEHAMSIHWNMFFVLLLAAWIYPTSFAKRTVLLAGLPIVLIAYIANNRRASFITMALAIVVIAFIMYRLNRRQFWWVAPPLAAIGLVYLLVFWNSSGALGAPAKAIKSVIGEADVRDASSNVYRLFENTNIMFTIKTSPLFGVGFGQKFYVLVPMADISSFVWWEYITHNSILWIWMKTGIGGFLSMLWMVGMAIATGTRTLWQMPRNELGMAATLAVCYVMMHFVFAYVDMSWDAQNMVLVGTMMGLISCLLPIAARQPEPQLQRWPWSPLLATAPATRLREEPV